MFGFVKTVWRRFSEDDGAGKAAALSYYTIFSLGPLLFVIFGILGLVLKSPTYKTRLLDQLQHLVGPQAGSLINGVLNHQTLSGKTGWAFLIGGVGLVLGAIGIFGQLSKSINEIMHLKRGPDAGLKTVVKQKLLSLGLVGVICFLLLVSLIASAAVSLIVSKFSHDAAAGFLFTVLDLLGSLVVFTLLLALLYRTLPEVKLPWRPLFAAGFVIALLMSVGKILLGIIIGNNGNISAFGAAGSLIALLLWIFYFGQVIYLGAAALADYADRHALQLTPRYGGKKAVLLTRKVEKPLPQTVTQKLKHRFQEGLKRGWRS